MHRVPHHDSWFWTELRELFEVDDGSLPEVRVDYTDAGATSAGYALLRTRAASVLPEGARLGSRTGAEPRPLDSVPDAAALVVAGEAVPFHVLLRGVRAGGVALPDLGVFVFPGQLAIDYRMGAAWGPAEVGALLELLADLTRLDPNAALSLEDGVDVEWVARFRRALLRWSAESAR